MNKNFRSIIKGFSVKQVSDGEYSFSFNDQKERCYAVYVDGQFKVLTDGNPVEDSRNFTAWVEDGDHDVEVLGVGDVDKNSIPFFYENMFYVKKHGSMIRLTWDAASATDTFRSYKLMKKIGSGEYALEAELFGVDSNSYLVQGIEEGETYTFKVSMTDIAGNESNYSEEFSIEAELYPNAPVVYSEFYEGSINLIFSPPLEQSPDVVGFAVYSNIDYDTGETMPYVIFGRDKRVKFVSDLAGGTYSYFPYSNSTPTEYKFAVTCVDCNGLESDFEEQSYVIKDGVQQAAKPKPPKSIFLSLAPDGAITAEVEIEPSADEYSYGYGWHGYDATEVVVTFSHGGVDEIFTIPVTTTTVYTQTSAANTEKQEYSVSAYCLNVDTPSDITGPVYLTNLPADDTAPTGVTGELVE